MAGSHAGAQSTSPFYTLTGTVACPADKLVRDTGTPEWGNQTLHKACLSLVHACCCSRRILTFAPPGRERSTKRAHLEAERDIRSRVGSVSFLLYYDYALLY